MNKLNSTPFVKSILFILFYTLLSVSKIYSDNLQPNPLMKQETKWLVQALQQAHYNKVQIDELDSTAFIKSYLKKLDKQKLYFTEPEIKKFLEIYPKTLITFFKQGNLFPGFEIYNLYRKKSLDRIDWVLGKLKKGFVFDTNETYLTDREDLPWEKNFKDLDGVWIKLLKFEVLSETISGTDFNSSNSSYSSFKKLIPDSIEKVIKRYERWQKSILEFESTDVQEIYLSTLTQMFDPHTTFMNIKEKEKFDQTMNNELVGIGAVLEMIDGYCTIKELLPGGPAEASRGLDAQDKIIEVAQAEKDFVDVVDMKLSKIVDLIKGPKDTLVRLKVKPVSNPETTKVVRIIRDKIKLTSNLAKATVKKVINENEELNVGIIELRSFYGATGNGAKATDDVEELVGKLKNENVEGIILDLRRNGGGYLSEAVNLAGLFISRGPVVQVKSTDGKIRKKFDFNPKLVWDKPLIILVSRYSASASEIVAGALQNHRRAIIVGDKNTHGKGTVQSLLQMNLPFNYNSSNKKKSAAKITIQKYYLPSGQSTQINGVIGDISMPSINHFLPIGESDLENALACDSIPAVNFRRPSKEFIYDEKTLASLRENSLKRQNELEEFQYLKENVERYKYKKNQTNVSLNYNKRIEQKLNDKEFDKGMSEKFEKLTDKAYPEKNIQLDIVDDQNTISRKVRGEKALDEHKIQNFSKPKSLDIRLHESCRIMAEWISLLKLKPLSQKDNSEVQGI